MSRTSWLRMLGVTIILPIVACTAPVDEEAPSGALPEIRAFSVHGNSQEDGPRFIDTQADERFDFDFYAENPNGFRFEAYITTVDGAIEDGIELFNTPCGIASVNSSCTNGPNSMRCTIDRDSGSLRFICDEDTIHKVEAEAGDYFANTNGLPADYDVHIRACNSSGCATRKQLVTYR